MIRIAGVPVRTRLPATAWVIAGLLVLFTMAPSLAHFITSGGAATAELRLASVGHLLASFAD